MSGVLFGNSFAAFAPYVKAAYAMTLQMVNFRNSYERAASICPNSSFVRALPWVPKCQMPGYQGHTSDKSHVHRSHPAGSCLTACMGIFCSQEKDAYPFGLLVLKLRYSIRPCVSAWKSVCVLRMSAEYWDSQFEEPTGPSQDPCSLSCI